MTSKAFLDTLVSFPTMDDLEAMKLSEDENILFCEKIMDEIEDYPKTHSGTEMLKLAFLFSDSEGDYMNFDDSYLHAIERTLNYPPKELYEDRSNNEMIIRLRDRCWRAQIIRDSPQLPTLYKFIKPYFDVPNQEDNLFAYIPKKEIDNLTPHEVRLLLEIMSMFPSDDKGYYIWDKLIAQIDNYEPLLEEIIDE